MNDIPSNISTIGIVLLYHLCACISVIYDYFARRSTILNFIGISKKQILLGTVIGKYHTVMMIQCVYFVLAQFHPKNATSQPLFFDIENW